MAIKFKVHPTPSSEPVFPTLRRWVGSGSAGGELIVLFTSAKEGVSLINEAIPSAVGFKEEWIPYDDPSWAPCTVELSSN